MSAYAPPPGSIPTLLVPRLAELPGAHLVGIGGAGMSGMARLLMAREIPVSGCDLKDSPVLTQLRSIGVDVRVGHDPGHVGGAGSLVISTAIPPDAAEVAAARARRVPVWARAQVLAALMAEHRGLAVAGTHGKTSTTSMLATILERSGRDPTYLIGGDLNESGSNARAGSGSLFVAEADESDGSFLLLRPELAVITNVEEDHLDFYRDRHEVEAAFAAFCGRAGDVVACVDDEGVRRVLDAAGVPARTYGTGDADLRVEGGDVARGRSTCRLRTAGEDADLVLSIPGRHHLLNAAGAILAAMTVGLSLGDAAAALAGFEGVRRRFERRGTARGASFVDDYAHHPTEIEATLAAARPEGARRVVAVFQPHRYSRTAAMWRALGESLAGADVVVLTDVYGAGEDPTPGVSGKLLVDALLEAAPRVRTIYLPRRADVAPFLAGEIREGDLVLTLGAGDVTMVGDETMALVEGGR